MLTNNKKMIELNLLDTVNDKIDAINTVVSGILTLPNPLFEKLPEQKAEYLKIYIKTVHKNISGAVLILSNLINRKIPNTKELKGVSDKKRIKTNFEAVKKLWGHVRSDILETKEIKPDTREKLAVIINCLLHLDVDISFTFEIPVLVSGIKHK